MFYFQPNQQFMLILFGMNTPVIFSGYISEIEFNRFIDSSVLYK